jgi:hypothetical protein
MNLPRKSLPEYFLEGAMIFVAVTLGFLADNLRDHIADRETERAYMHAIVEDLAIDSIRLSENVERLDRDIANADSMVLEYIAGRRTGRFAPGISDHGRFAGNSVDLVFNDRTSSQLKGTGAMRLVRDTAVASALLRYWNNQERLREIRDRFEAIRLEQRKIGWRTFNWYQPVFARFNTSDQAIADDLPPAILDPRLVAEFVNTTSSLYNLAQVMFRPELHDQIGLGTTIRARIRQAYP